METKILEPNEQNILLAADIIKKGGLVAFPTETVYGLGADATNENAASAIYKAKGRPSDNPLIIHISKPEQAEKYAVTNKYYYKLTECFSPGPLTIILPKRSIIPYATSGGLDTVAVRIPDNNTALALIDAAQTAIAAPSANSSGKPSPTRAIHVYDDLNGKISLILDGGECRIGVESTVIKLDGSSCTILRPGGVTAEQLQTVCTSVTYDKGLLNAVKEDFKPLAPGMKYKHYAPSAEVYMVKGDYASVCKFMQNKVNELGNVGIICYDEGDVVGDYVRTFSTSGERQAHELFDILRYFDKTEVQVIYTVIPDNTQIGCAVLNRLCKAAGFKTIDLNTVTR